MRDTNVWALAPLMALALAACGDNEGSATGNSVAVPAAAPSTKTLDAEIRDNADLDTLDGVIKAAGLSEVLASKGPYTVFAPSNASLSALSGSLTGDAQKAQSAALLRAHIVPGTLTRADILAAIERGGDDGIQMRTMADTLLTFSRDGDKILVTAPDGAVAHLTGREAPAANGVLQPTDGILVKSS